MRLPGERDYLLEELRVGLRRPVDNAKLLIGAHQHQRIALGDQPDVGHADLRAGLADRVGHHVGLDRVVVQIVGTHPALTVRALGNRVDFHHHLTAVEELCSPSFRPAGGSRGDSRSPIQVTGGRPSVTFVFGFGSSANLLEIELPGQRRHDADAGLAGHVADLRRDDRGRICVVARRLEFAAFGDFARASEREFRV